MRATAAPATHFTSTDNAQCWCNALLVLSFAARLPVLLAPSKHANRDIFDRIRQRDDAQAEQAKAHDAARVAQMNAAHRDVIAANVANERKRAVLAVVATLARECAARACGAWIDTRLRGAIADACAAHAIPTLSGIPHALTDMPIPEAKTEAAIAAHAFAARPDVANWIATDRALTQLSRSLYAANDARPGREMSMTAPACDPPPPPVYRVHSDDINQMHAGSAGVSKIKPGSCPPTYASAADKREAQARAAKRQVASLLAKHASDTQFGRYIRACRALTF